MASAGAGADAAGAAAGADQRQLDFAAENPWGACSCRPFAAAEALDRQGAHTLQDFEGGEFFIAGRPLIVHNADHRGNEDTGLSVWDGAVVMAKWLERRDCAGTPLVRGRRVLELGCGTGLGGLAALVLGAQHVALTDLEYALPAVRANVARNDDAAAGSWRDKCEVCVLDWRSPDLPPFAAAAEVFLAADCVWRLDMVAPLLQVLEACLTSTGGGAADSAKVVAAAAVAAGSGVAEAAAAAARTAADMQRTAVDEADDMGLGSFLCEQRPPAALAGDGGAACKQCFLCYTFRFQQVHRAFFDGLEQRNLEYTKLDTIDVYGEVFLPSQTGEADPIASIYRIVAKMR